ncbi:MAG TPA: peptidylprolyl isomerase [Patescibacteria group bacterium]|jgi:parvulin-like peptidyl-prolyl isomerase|nr:peptidylprolyl isomerase [Patescibacteria group bacterium]
MENIDDEDKIEVGSESETETHHHPRKRRSKKHKMTIAGVIVLIILIIAGGLTWLYTGKVAGAKEKVFKVLPLPAAIVDMKFVSAKEALARIELAKQLMEAQGAGDATDSGQTYDQLIEAKKLSAVAARHHITVSSDEINEEYNNIVKQYADGDEGKFKDELDSTYHMSPDKFKAEVIKQELEQSNLAIWFSKQEDLNKDAYATAKDLQGKLDSGQSFDDVAKAYTQDEATKDFAGDSGLIAFDGLLPEFRTELKDAKVGDVKLVPSRYGLHIIKVLEENNDGANGAKQIHLQQIFVKQGAFTDWAQQQADGLRVVKLLNFS